MLELTPFYEALFPPTEKPVAEMADDDSPLAEVVLKRRLSSITSSVDNESSTLSKSDLSNDDDLGANDVKKLKLDSDETIALSPATPLSTTTPHSLSSPLTVTKTLPVNYVNQTSVCSAHTHSVEHAPLYAHHSRTEQQQQQQQQNQQLSSAITNCEQTTIRFSPGSYSSSDSFSDDEDDAEDDDDEDDSEDDDDEDDIIDIDLEEVELAHENSFNSTGMASTESESGYDERSSSEGSNESESFESVLPSGTTFTASLSDGQQQLSQHQPHPSHHAQQQQLQSQHLQQQQQQNAFSISMPIDSNSSVFCSYTPPTAYYVGSSIHTHSHHQGALNGPSGPLTRSANGQHSHLHSHSQPPPLPPPSESQKVLQKKQTIFSICLQKLQRYRACSDSSLVKSVLVCNTLRCLERDFKRAGVELNFGPNGVQFNSSPVIDSPVADLDILPSPQPGNATTPLQQPQPHSQQHSPACSGFTCQPSDTPQTTPIESEASSLHCSQASDTNNNCKPSTMTFSDDQTTNSESTANNNHPVSGSEFHSQPASLCSAFSGWPNPEDEARLENLNWASDFGPARHSAPVDAAVDSIDMISPSYSNTMDNDSSASNNLPTNVTGTFATLMPSGQSSTSADVVSVSGTLLESTSYAFDGTNSSTNTVTSTISNSSSFLSYTTTTGSDEIFADIDMSLYDFDLFGNTLGSSLTTGTKSVSSTAAITVTPTLMVDELASQLTTDSVDSAATQKNTTETMVGVTPCV